MPSPSLLVLGLDGTDWEMLDPLLRGGDLPVLAGLARGGFRARLRSTIPPLTAPAWTSLHTGVNPGAHGVFDFFFRDAASYAVRHASAAPCTTRTVWGHLSDRGRRVLLVGMPMAEAEEPLAGVHVGSITLEPGTACPETARRALARRFDPGAIRRGRVAEGAAFARRWIDRTFAIASHLARAERFDVLGVGIPVTDWMHHRFLLSEGAAGAGPIRDTYRALDAALGRFLDTLRDVGEVVVCSDHGAQGARGLLNVNGWLAERGFLAHAGGPARGRARGGIGAGVRRAVRALVPESVRTGLRARRGAHAGVGTLAHLDGVDWSRTRAYAVGYYAGIYLNVAGREPEGTVPEGAREAVAAEVAAALREWRDPETGEAVMEAALRGSEVYHGRFAAAGPDVVGIPAGYRWGGVPLPYAGAGVPAIRTSRELTRERGADLAWHRLHGMLLMSGRGALGPSERGENNRSGDGVPVTERSILDVAPTILQLLGEPVPPWMEGAPVTPLSGASPADGSQDAKSAIVQPQSTLDRPFPPHWDLPSRACPPTPLERRLGELGYLE